MRAHFLRISRAERGSQVSQISGLGVTWPFARNCTLSGALSEHLGNGPDRPRSVCGPSGVPVMVAGERDVLSAERRDVGEQFIGDVDALWPELLDGPVEVNGVPVNDGDRQQAQSGCPEALVLERAVAE